MAFKLSLTSFHNFSISIDCTQKKFLKNPNLILPSLNTFGFCSIKVSNSSKVTASIARGALPHAVKEEKAQTIQTQVAEINPSSSKLVLVVGGTGGVGQLVVASLLNRNIKSRLLLRDPQKAEFLFGKQDENALKVCKGDTRNPDDLNPVIFENIGILFHRESHM
eukprot:TRINITY_DN5884_c0_g1_i4.p1 TRINITY_DN5884_c0_g1~~TRINITY_DN5884_c0_g1_i4.p1  ORF type:complete len:165 (-),score=28.78 TRINITY_DN5884_c0_g1_i4:260-754(-)